MQLCFFGTYTVGAGYPVNRVLREGLGRAATNVFDCRAEAWGPFVHRALSPRNPLRLALLGIRLLRAWMRLRSMFRRLPDCDWTVVGYPGFLDVHLARRLDRRRPLALVSFISLYDTVVSDRARISTDSWFARLLHRLDRASFECADVVFVDTDAQGDYYADLFGLERRRFVRSFVGEQDSDYPFVPAEPRGEEPLRVLFFGTYVPLHGVDTIIKAACHLRGENGVRLRLIGTGQMYESLRAHADEQQIGAEFITDWVPPSQLAGYIADAHVCLGVFGTTAKAGRVIPYKVFDAAAVGRAIITRDSPAIRELFDDGESALLCPAGDGAALAQAILRLRDDDDLRCSLSSAAHRVYQNHGSPEAIGREAARQLQAVAATKEQSNA